LHGLQDLSHVELMLIMGPAADDNVIHMPLEDTPAFLSPTAIEILPHVKRAGQGR
jgi:hypothetical protein